jgi:hypothetical protein
MSETKLKAFPQKSEMKQRYLLLLLLLNNRVLEQVLSGVLVPVGGWKIWGESVGG